MTQIVKEAYIQRRAVKNNDPLAHVYLLQDSYDRSIARHRMYNEFNTDMGERLKGQPFLGTYKYVYNGSEIIYDTGLRYFASLEQSYQAAKDDVRRGEFNDYHVLRQQAFLDQGVKVAHWLEHDIDAPHMVVFSLCPSSDELSPDEARKQSFKPDRQMASIQIHSRCADGGFAMTAFSLDGLTLERLQELLYELGSDAAVASTTLEQLNKPLYIDDSRESSDLARYIIDMYDAMLAEANNSTLFTQGIHVEKNMVEANSFVKNHPETFELYSTVITEVAQSLESSVTPALAATLRDQLAIHYSQHTVPHFLTLRPGDALTNVTASAIIDYLRTQAIPEYLTERLPGKVRSATSSWGTSADYSIGAAGSVAVAADRQYDGACPSSGAIISAQDSLQQQAMQMGINKPVSSLYEVPRSILSKGDYDVIPIGSCPVCGSECGTGIRNKKSGKWYCTQPKCRAYNQEIYSFVFDTDSASTPTTEQHISKGSNQKSQKNKFKQAEETAHNSQIQAIQEEIWVLKDLLYSEEMEASERAELIDRYIQLHQYQQHILRASLGR